MRSGGVRERGEEGGIRKNTTDDNTKATTVLDETEQPQTMKRHPVVMTASHYSVPHISITTILEETQSKAFNNSDGLDFVTGPVPLFSSILDRRQSKRNVGPR